MTDVLWVCVDCLLALANGESTSDEHDLAFDTGIKRLQSDGGQVVCGDGEKEFSHSQCDLCLSKLGGSRHEAHIITVP